MTETLGDHPETIGILYPGEMGSALAKVFRANGCRVVSTVAGRSSRTCRLAEEADIETLPNQAQVVETATILISSVPPAVALDLAQEVCQQPVRKDTLLVDINSISPQTAQRISAICDRAAVGFLDVAIRGLAHSLSSNGEVYVSGAQSERVALLLKPLAVRLLGDEVGAASRLKMLMSGMSKGVAALFIELSVAADRAGMLDTFIAGTGRYYPDLLAAMQSVVPTYPQHAHRRSQELAEVESFLAECSQPSEVVAGGRHLLEKLATTGLGQRAAALRTASLEEVISAMAHELMASAEAPPAEIPTVDHRTIC